MAPFYCGGTSPCSPLAPALLKTSGDGGVPLEALVESEASGSFMDLEFAWQYQILTRVKPIPDLIEAVDGFLLSSSLIR